MGSRRCGVLVVTVLALVVGGCGTRASEDEVRAGAGGPPVVTLDQKSIDALREVVAAPAPAASAVGSENRAVPSGAASTSREAPVAVAGSAAAGSVGAPAPSAAAARPSSGCGAPGAPVNLGQIGSFGGVAGPLTEPTRTALAVWAKHVNARGGVACHPVQLYSVDDGGDPSRTAALVGELVTKHRVAALVGVITFGMGGLLPAIEREKLPVVGGEMLAPQWFAHPLLFPQGAGLATILNTAAKQSVDEGRNKHGLLYCVEVAVCAEVGKQYPLSAEQVGAQIVYRAPVSLTQTDFTAQCQNAKGAGVQALGVALEGSAIARLARSCSALGYHPQFVMAGGVVSSQQAEDPGIRRSTIATASSNAPWMLTDTAGQREYAAALARYAPGAVADGPSMIGWTSGKLFEAALATLGESTRADTITSATVLSGLGRIQRETLGGLSPPLTFQPGQRAAPRIACAYPEVLTADGWSAPRGSTPVCFR